MPEDCVRISRPTDSSHCSADVRVEDPQFSMRLCELLALKRHGSPIAVPINVSMPQATNHRRIDSKKVYCSWHKPTKTAWLNFGNGGVAAKVGLKFSAGTYKILDQSVQCEGPTRGAGSRNPLAWTLKLSNVPKLAKKEDVIRAIPVAMAPRHVELSGASYEVDLPKANSLIESLLLQVGPLERWEGSLEVPGKRFKAKAWFMNDADALQAVKLFHNEPLSFNKNGKLTVKLVHTARFKILARIYDAVEQELSDHKKTWASQHVLCTAYPPAQGLQVLKIEGENGGDVARAKAALERIISGEVMMKDGKPIWAPSFATNGYAYQRIKQLERELGVLIVRDKRKSQLRLLGPQMQREEAQLAVIELANAHPNSMHVIELDVRQFSWAFKGGYRAIAEAIGTDKVVLDIASCPRRILVVGSKADLNIAREILQRGQGVLGEKTEPDSTSDCVICWTPADNPIQTACKHLYCTGCFEDLCFAGVNSGPGIRCQGDAGNCSEILLLTELQLHLSSAALEDMLEAAFTTHVARHPIDFQYCPTPDCGQIYRAARPAGNNSSTAITSESPLFKCPTCLVAICIACNVSYDGLTCAEHRYYLSGDYKALQAAKKKLGIKDCPSCGTLIEKTFGCNHMTCSACETHICWVCLQTFPKSGQVYDHMRHKHGGIGIPEFPDLVY